MTTPTPAALEAARKCLARLPPEHDNGSGPEPCLSCDADRQEYLAAAFEAFARDVMSNHWCEAHPSKPTLRHHQEDADNAS